MEIELDSAIMIYKLLFTNTYSTSHAVMTKCALLSSDIIIVRSTEWGEIMSFFITVPSGVSSEVLRVLKHPPQLLASFFSRLACIVIYPIIFI